MPDESPASTHSETFPQCCSRLIFLARDECQRKGTRISPAIIERIIQEQQKAFNLIPAKPVLIETIAETIYAAYPRHIGKKTALKAICGAMRSLPSTELLAKTMLYAKAVSKWPPADRDFIPHPSTWFNRGSYLDDQSEWIRGAKKETREIDYSKL